jgi:hypothetical protein
MLGLLKRAAVPKVPSLAAFKKAFAMANSVQKKTGVPAGYRQFLPKPAGPVTKVYTENIPYAGGLRAGLGAPLRG